MAAVNCRVCRAVEPAGRMPACMARRMLMMSVSGSRSLTRLMMVPLVSVMLRFRRACVNACRSACGSVSDRSGRRVRDCLMACLQKGRPRPANLSKSACLVSSPVIAVRSLFIRLNASAARCAAFRVRASSSAAVASRRSPMVRGRLRRRGAAWLMLMP